MRYEFDGVLAMFILMILVSGVMFGVSCAKLQPTLLYEYNFRAPIYNNGGTCDSTVLRLPKHPDSLLIFIPGHDTLLTARGDTIIRTFTSPEITVTPARMVSDSLIFGCPKTLRGRLIIQ